MRRVLVSLLLLAACSTADEEPGASRRQAKQFVEYLAKASQLAPDQQPPILAAACAEVPTCAKPCERWFADYAQSRPDYRGPQFAQGCEEATHGVIGGSDPDALAAGLAAYVRGRTAACAEHVRDALSDRERRDLDRIRAELAL